MSLGLAAPQAGIPLSKLPSEETNLFGQLFELARGAGSIDRAANGQHEREPAKSDDRQHDDDG